MPPPLPSVPLRAERAGFWLRLNPEEIGFRSKRANGLEWKEIELADWMLS